MLYVFRIHTSMGCTSKYCLSNLLSNQNIVYENVMYQFQQNTRDNPYMSN